MGSAEEDQEAVGTRRMKSPRLLRAACEHS